MFVTKNRNVKIPDTLLVGSNYIRVVSEFKILGITEDKNLTFKKHVCDIKKNINK